MQFKAVYIYICRTINKDDIALRKHVNCCSNDFVTGVFLKSDYSSSVKCAQIEV